MDKTEFLVQLRTTFNNSNPVPLSGFGYEPLITVSIYEDYCLYTEVFSPHNEEKAVGERISHEDLFLMMQFKTLTRFSLWDEEEQERIGEVFDNSFRRAE